jgi:hypothetical protein
MTEKLWPERPAVYELTISGRIGPLIRSALRPHSTAPSQTCTILRTGTVPGDAVPDLMRLLHRRGVEVEVIFETGPVVHWTGRRAP